MFDSLVAVIPSPDGKETVLPFEIKLVPVTSLLKAREGSAYNQIVTGDSGVCSFLWPRMRFVWPVAPFPAGIRQ